MQHFLYKSWWKWLCAAILLYITIGGLSVPLSPGIVSISPSVSHPDTIQSFIIHGYNTHFNPAVKPQVFFKADTSYFCADKIVVISPDQLEVTFGISSKTAAQISDNNYDVIINDKADGTVALWEGLTFITATTASGTDSSAATATCDVAVENNKFEGIAFPYREILYESVRNTFYHVPMWFTMMFLLILSTYYSIKYLRTNDMDADFLASQSVVVALVFGILGLVTGMTWANYTWGEPWPNDPKLNGAAVGVMIYVAYIILRGSIDDELRKARVSAVYNVFAVVIFILFIFIIPRLPQTDSLHPGNGGNPAFSKYDLDSILRLFFYPAVIGWALMGLWLLSILFRIKKLENRPE
jgi:heme exporter protein C